MNRNLTSTRTQIHKLKGKNPSCKEVLIITSFDYFLQKRDISRLQMKFKEVILIPQSTDDFYLLNKTVAPLISLYSRIRIVINPQYDHQHQVIYELAARNNKTVTITTIYDFCENELKKVYIPEKFEYTNPNIEESLNFKRRIKYPKKVIDIFISFFLMFFSLPFWLVSYFRIKLQSPGPAFFYQSRVGMKNTLFNCIKFRSMGLDAEANGAIFSRKNDKRVFPYGAFMRATRIDELPQLINIFRRDISLIGPRPERPEFTESFEETIPYYNIRHNVKPGITGYAQIMYPYGAGVRDARHKLMYDLYYIKNWSIALELRIIIMTTVIILARKGR